jgi:hypothetical protein
MQLIKCLPIISKLTKNHDELKDVGKYLTGQVLTAWQRPDFSFPHILSVSSHIASGIGAPVYKDNGSLSWCFTEHYCGPL